MRFAQAHPPRPWQSVKVALLLVLQHQAQLISQVWISLLPMLGRRMVDRLIQDFFFRA